MKSMLFLSLVLCLILTACGPAMESPPAESTDKTTVNTNVPVPATTEIPESAVYDDSLIQEQVKSGTVKQEDGSDLFSYEYHIPQILQDSEAAKKLNQELMKASPSEAGLNRCESMNWESHWNGSLLSLILRFRYPSSLRYEYQVINYDFALQKTISRAELLEKFSIQEENLMQQLRFTAADYLDHANKDMEQTYMAGLWDLRAQTLSNENLRRAPRFVDDTGTLAAIVTVNVPAGCGYETPALQLKAPEPVDLMVTDSYATAELRDGNLAVTFHKDENSTWSMDENYVPHDFSIPVDRLYGNFVDIAIGNLANEFWPVVLLLDENGQVSWVDLSSYDGKTFSFHGVGPVICSSPVADFSTHEVWGHPTLCGLDAEGNTIDLYQSIYDASSCLSPYLSATNWSTEDGKFHLQFPEDDKNWQINWMEGSIKSASGMVHCVGMDGDGIHYQWNLFGPGADLFGVMTLQFPPADSGDMPSLLIQNHSQSSLPGLPAESEKVLIWEHP